MRKINFTSLDLEFNVFEEKDRPFDYISRIIQVGAVIGNLETGEILDDFCEFVNPYELLNPRITELTKIKQIDVDRAFNLKDVYQKLKEKHLKYDCFCNVICWGGGDSLSLRKQLSIDGQDDTDWCFGRRWLDAKTLYVAYRWANGKDISGGLAKSLTKFGMAFRGQKHNARDDAFNTFLIYRKLIDFFKAQSTF